MINNIKTFFNYLTVVILLALTLYRFRIKVPREIFENTTLVYFIVYIFVVLVNIGLLLSLYLKHINYTTDMNKNTVFIKVVLSVKDWIDFSYKKFMDNVANTSGYFSEVLAFITHYFIKIPLRVFSITSYITKTSLILALIYDILVLEKFIYFYYTTYLLLILLLLKALLYISIEVNQRILQEYHESIIIIDFAEAYKNSNNLNETYFELSEHNKQFTSVKQALSIGSLVLAELDKLNLIKEHFQESYKFQLFIRLCYILLFSYIVYYYLVISYIIIL